MRTIFSSTGSFGGEVDMTGQVGFLQSVERANSHIRYARYRKKIGDQIPLRTVARSWWRRFIYEYFGAGFGA